MGPASELPFMHDVGRHPQSSINDFYKKSPGSERYDYEWRNPHVRYPDGYPMTDLGSASSPPTVQVTGP